MPMRMLCRVEDKCEPWKVALRNFKHGATDLSSLVKDLKPPHRSEMTSAELDFIMMQFGLRSVAKYGGWCQAQAVKCTTALVQN